MSGIRVAEAERRAGRCSLVEKSDDLRSNATCFALVAPTICAYLFAD